MFNPAILKMLGLDIDPKVIMDQFHGFMRSVGETMTRYDTRLANIEATLSRIEASQQNTLALPAPTNEVEHDNV